MRIASIAFMVFCFIAASCRQSRNCCSKNARSTKYYNRKNAEHNRKKVDKILYQDNMIFFYPEPTNNNQLDDKLKRKNKEIETQADFVFSEEVAARKNNPYKIGSFKFHDVKKKDRVLLENIEIENSSRFFTRNSIEEIWRLYIFLRDHETTIIKINGYPVKKDMYTNEENIDITKKAVEKIYDFLIHQNIEENRIEYKTYLNFSLGTKIPFYTNQPFWIEIVITGD